MLTPVTFIPHTDCTGCGSCKAACGVHCIEMQYDERGFLYPYIDDERCVKCGGCERACPVLNRQSFPHAMKQVFACRAANENIIKASSSGGLFTVFAEHILSRNGCVCGAAYDENFVVSHRVVDNISDLELLRSSKYVQSSTASALAELRKRNNEGKPIMFVGTPCQVAAAKRLLGARNEENHLFVEVVCHGVPSPMVYKKYVGELEMAAGARLVALNFRDKSNGWSAYTFHASFANGRSIIHDGHEDPYVSGFIDNLYLRECCFSCKFKAGQSGSDLTIGDFWGIDKVSPDLSQDNKGASLLCINTERGRLAFDAIKSQLCLTVETDLHHAVAKNPCLLHPTTYNPRTRRFYKYVRTHTVADAISLARKVTFIDRLMISLRYRFGKIFNAKS